MIKRFNNRCSAILLRIDRLVVVGGVMSVAGSIIMLVDFGKRWAGVNGVGAAIFGAGLAVLISTFTSKQAVSDQYRKEANLRRKDTIYAPLHAEIKKARINLEQAEAGHKPFPRLIDTGSGTVPRSAGMSDFAALTHTLPLTLWVNYKEDHRIHDFSRTSQQLCDNCIEAADTYNQALDAVCIVAVSILAIQIEAGIQRALEDPVFQEEKRAHGGTALNIRNEPVSDTIPFWIARLEYSRMIQPNLAEQRAQSWLVSWDGQPPRTLGWILTGDMTRAAKTLYDMHPRDQASMRRTPPLEWFERIFVEMKRDLYQRSDFEKVRDAEHKLIGALRATEKALENGLRYIQNRFEGGPPPV